MKLLRHIGILCIMFFIFSSNVFLYSIPNTIIVGYHEDFPPYVYKENGELKGIFPEMVSLAAQKLGISVHYRKFPWQRLLKCAESGEVDAIMPLFRAEEREEYLIYPECGIALGESYFFTRKDFKIKYTGILHELKQYSIGVVKNYSYGREFDHADYLRKDISMSDEALVRKFKNRRFQMGFGSNLVMNYYAQKCGVREQIKFLEPPFIRKILYIAFSKRKRHQELSKKFSEAIETLGTEGKHRQILEDYECGEDAVFFKEMVIGMDREDYPPYTFWENGKSKGVCVEIVNKAAKEMGVRIRYKKIDWKNIEALIRAKSIDAVMPVFKTTDRNKFLYYPQVNLITERNSFYTLKNSNISYNGNLKDLKGIPIGIVGSYSYGDTFDNAINLTKRPYLTFIELMTNFKNKKVNIILGNELVVDSYAKKFNMPDNINRIEPPFLPNESLYLAFSKPGGKGYKKLSESFSRAIKELKGSKIYQEILDGHDIKRQTIRLAADNWQPYYGKNLENGGLVSKIIREAFRRVDYQVSIDFMPRANLLKKVESGDYDAGFSFSRTSNREKHYYFSSPIHKTSMITFLKRKDTRIIYNGIEDLKNYNYKIGVVRGTRYVPGFDALKGIRRIESYNDEANIYNLLKERLDLVIIDKSHANYTLKKISREEKNKLEFMELFPEESREVTKTIHLVISRKCPDAEQILLDFNHGLKQIVADGTVDRLLKTLEAKHEHQ